jgi:hypothetical protein
VASNPAIEVTTKASLPVAPPVIPIPSPPRNSRLPVAPSPSFSPNQFIPNISQLQPLFELFQIFLPERKPVVLTSPYLGMHDDHIWDENGILGSVISPLEHMYFEWYPEHNLRKAQSQQ